MCLLIFKPKGRAIPSETVLRAAAKANPDGFGFATPNKYMRSLDFETFYKHLKSVKDDEPCIIHARWATHGSVKKSNCHPFRKDGVSFAHNGVLRIDPIGDKTDSETAFLLYILPAVKHYGLYSREVSEIVSRIIGTSKFALIDENGDSKLFGNFTRLEDGNFYSNLRWQYHLDYRFAV